MERLKNIGWALLCLGFAAVFAFIWGRDVVADLAHRNDAFEQAATYRLTEGKCRSKMFVISNCELKLRDTASGKTLEKEYFMLGNYGGTSISILKSTSDPTYLTTSMGREQLWNRVLLIFVPIGLFGFGGLVLLAKALRGGAPAAA
jgi:hypothetical protein